MTSNSDADSQDDLAGWIRLMQTPGVGPETARRLLQAFGLPDAIFSAPVAVLRTIVSDRIARHLSEPITSDIQNCVDKTFEWLQQSSNTVLTLADAAYPSALLTIPDPPVMLYVKGRIELLKAPSIAVVGSRNATAQGIANAERFSEALAANGLTVVSGLALGIDTAAHEGTLRHSGGSTVAVIGTGADIVYPARNRNLAHRIADKGCIVSEYALGTPAIAANFPRRNRIISGLARGVLVIEAAAQSGSLITARMAGEQGRDVFAVPGSIHSPLSKGCHLLIKQGAKLVESADDILEELGYRNYASIQNPQNSAAADHSIQESQQEDELLVIMGYDPMPVEVLAQRSRLEASALTDRLLMLELEGKVEVLPGNRYQRLH